MAQINHEQLPLITKSEIWKSNPLLKLCSEKIGINSRKEIRNLFIIILLPFIITLIATYFENCFFIGTVVSKKNIAILNLCQYKQLKTEFTTYYELGELTFSELIEEGVSDSIITMLKRIKKNIYIKKNDFLIDIEKYLEKQDFDKYKEIIITLSEKKLKLKEIVRPSIKIKEKNLKEKKIYID